MAFSDEGLHNFATFSLVLKIFEEKSLKPPWIFLQIWLRHQRKIIIIFKDEKFSKQDGNLCGCRTFNIQEQKDNASIFQLSNPVVFVPTRL